MKNGYSVFFISFLSVMLFTALERAVGIGIGFHPDSYYYLDNYEVYVHGIDTFILALNNFYFFTVYVASGNETSLIALNWILFSLTNVVVFRFVESRVNIVALVVMFLPYRMHLASHILKDTIIIFLCLLPFILRSFWSAPVGVILAGFRIPALPAMLFARFMPNNTRIVLLALAAVILLVSSVEALRVLMLDRSGVEMMGRDFFDVPLADADSVSLIILKSVVWPFLYKTGSYSVVSPNSILFGLALEQIILLAFALRGGLFRTYIFGRGALTLVIYALVVNSFGAYYRYGYAFYMLDAMVIAQLWNSKFQGADHDSPSVR